MPKLNTTIDNLELKSNKIISTSTESPDAWTDAQYPSAKTLYNLLNALHPVGSILTTSSKNSPAATFGGSWELVDKAFKYTKKVITDANSSSFWQQHLGVLGSPSNESSNIVTVCDHVVTICINIKAGQSVTITDDNRDLGKILPECCGITEFPYTIFDATVFSDEGDCLLACALKTDGTVEAHDVININDTHTIAAGSNFYIYFVIPVPHTLMKEDACDRFYWKRTA